MVNERQVIASFKYLSLDILLVISNRLVSRGLTETDSTNDENHGTLATPFSPCTRDEGSYFYLWKASLLRGTNSLNIALRGSNYRWYFSFSFRIHLARTPQPLYDHGCLTAM